MTRERGGAAGLRVADCALRVACRRRGEDDAADDEDERRQPEGDTCNEAERVIDRRADVAVGGGEQGIRPENAVELVRLTTPAGHARRLVRLSEELLRNRGENTLAVATTDRVGCGHTDEKVARVVVSANGTPVPGLERGPARRSASRGSR